MSQENQNPNQAGNNEDTSSKTPLEQVQEQQAMKQEDREVREQRVDADAEVPGQSSPSNIRKHPQRQLG